MEPTVGTSQPRDALTKASAITDPQVFYESIASKLEAVFGQNQPQLEVRFSNVTVSCKVATLQPREHEGSSPELPTIWNVLKNTAADLVSKRKTETREILKDVSGVLRPGTMTLVLGQPGSGKSTLLKLLSGKLRADGNRVRVEGEITYNGEPQHLVAAKLPQLAAYVPQHDQHFALLSVKETLSFAHAFSTSGGGDLAGRADALLGHDSRHEDRQTLKSAFAMFAHYPEVIKTQLGLHNCWDTMVGDGMVRGVSGGEKKRVTTGEMCQGMHQASFMDEISTGLDSAATFDIINAQRTIAHRLGKTMVISLLQPPPEVFALFDDIILLNDGEVMYYGPRGRIVDYFRELGLECLPNRDVADFLLDLGTPQQSVYERRGALSGMKPPRLSTKYAEVFRCSDVHRGMLERFDEPMNCDSLIKGYIKSTPEYLRGVWANIPTLVQRQLTLISRDVNTLWSRVILVLIAALVSSTTFMNVEVTNASTTMGVILMSTLFPLFEQTSQLSMFVSMRDIFYKQRSANFFQTPAYVLASAISQIPTALPESFIYGAFLYWITGLEASAGLFILYEVIIFLTVMAAVMIFFFVAAISPNIYIANPLALGILQLVLVFAGFVVTRSQIPDYLIWIYWINPMSWAFRALAVSQYRSSTLDVCKYNNIDYCSDFGKTMGEYYLSVYDVSSGREWIVFGIVYLIAITLLFMALSYLALEYKRYENDFSPTRSKSKEAEDSSHYELATTPKHRSHGPATSLNMLDGSQVIDIHSYPQTVEPVTVAFKNVWYSVPNANNTNETIDLLKGVSGVARPGTITALMGSSGAGKTTLIDVIAGRKNTGVVRGKILLNGHEATSLTIRRCTGYCEQTDIHSQTATIYEALAFSAFLRQDSEVSASAKLNSVNEIINLLDLQDIADHMVRGSSLEQMKRLTIGIELAAQPSVLFLDEPTSGLDARFAKIIMDGIRKVANSGHTIICTIHQPSYDVFSVFDNLLLLKRGGETVFFGDLGEECQTLIEYFEAIRGVCSGLGIIFVAFQFQGFVSFNSAIPFAFDDRAAFYRERSAQTYATFWYFVGETLVEIPYVFTKGLIISVVIFLCMGVSGFGKFILFWLAVSLSIMVDVYIGQFLAFALPNIVMASLTGSGATTVIFLFVGFNPPGNAILAGYKWLYIITPHRYAMSILGALVYGECSTTPELDTATGEYVNIGPEVGCQPLQDAPVSVGNVTVKGLLEDVYNLKYDDMASNFGALLISIVVFRVLTLLALHFLNHQKR
ncbi:hypothetical protein JM18_002517 [Phytophthora kernoviae]|uniref:ABC transporter domain-containing protein n=2 Tax=Phytophthora kernoviae TaxID=325452 RepID=A0A8T0LZT5_9STRA|nr:hypothetical protein G195_005023 [Phytophthora kernoviae 00238/432]KAG2524735.1 hypothetical protein JM16_004823 [Phytophthora kernoviae]KAG2530099.1 hypothetical protein JM18_002517 [Phytophthora kernoviae]